MRGGGDEVNQKKKEGQRFRRSNFVAIPSKDDSRFFFNLGGFYVFRDNRYF